MIADWRARRGRWSETTWAHSDGIVVAFLPKEKILFQADVTLPQAGAGPNPFVQSPGENLGRLKLDVNAYLSVHDTPLQQTRKDLMAATGVSYERPSGTGKVERRTFRPPARNSQA